MKNFSALVALLSLSTLETAEAVGLTPWEELEAGASRLLGISSKAKSNTQSDVEVPHIDSDVAASGPSDMDDYFESNKVNQSDNDLDSVEDDDGELDDSEDELNG